MPAPEDPEQRRRRRALLRAHHPDLGGDPAELVRALQELQRAPRGAGEVVFVRRPRGLRRLAPPLRLLLRRSSRLLPRLARGRGRRPPRVL
ncbi:hypothetical protein [Quadrisphaera sp. DSM 44207]|uniref:hypothetical protein n=1 Tax=Quadrisphaera sp. DSM 44207 TaxID=1881057 RepID=UPI000890563C|nr:hypothetical protein [Quadrisphaera sp. DSM 44207]SDQ85623.1 hypothetical protein SAMN05428996_2911 [Quadrisphaera sp. DSM 44207]